MPPRVTPNPRAPLFLCAAALAAVAGCSGAPDWGGTHAPVELARPAPDLSAAPASARRGTEFRVGARALYVLSPGDDADILEQGTGDGFFILYRPEETGRIEGDILFEVILERSAHEETVTGFAAEYWRVCGGFRWSEEWSNRSEPFLAVGASYSRIEVSGGDVTVVPMLHGFTRDGETLEPQGGYTWDLFDPSLEMVDVYDPDSIIDSPNAPYRTVPIGLGGCQLIPADVFKKIGGFYPCFDPIGGEDKEISIRLWRRGYAVVEASRATVKYLVQEHDDAEFKAMSTTVWANLLKAQMLHFPPALLSLQWEMIREVFDGNEAQYEEIWSLCHDSTVFKYREVEDMLSTHSIQAYFRRFGIGPSPALSVDEILSDYAASTWIKEALEKALDRDPVDAANDAEMLSQALAQRAEKMAEEAQEAPND